MKRSRAVIILGNFDSGIIKVIGLFDNEDLAESYAREMPSVQAGYPHWYTRFLTEPSKGAKSSGKKQDE
jgi:hypothetical protein